MGQAYQAVIGNSGPDSVSVTSLSIAVPATGFTFVPGSVAVVPSVPVSVTGGNPAWVTFTPPVLLDPGQTLTINYNLSTDCTDPAGQQPLLASADYVTGTADSVTDTVTSDGAVTTLPGSVAVSLSPVAPLPFDQQVGHAITVRALISNLGGGTVFNTPSSPAG